MKHLTLATLIIFVAGCAPTPEPKVQSTPAIKAVPTTKPTKPAPTTPPPTATPSPTKTPSPTAVPVAKRFSEGERQEIFRQIVEAEDKGDKEAQAMYPTDLNNPSVTADMARDNVEPYANLSNKLEEKYRNKVFRKFRLSEKEQSLISVEGLTNHWPPLDQGYQSQ